VQTFCKRRAGLSATAGLLVLSGCELACVVLYVLGSKGKPIGYCLDQRGLVSRFYTVIPVRCKIGSIDPLGCDGLVQRLRRTDCVGVDFVATESIIMEITLRYATQSSAILRIVLRGNMTRRS